MEEQINAEEVKAEENNTEEIDADDFFEEELNYLIVGDEYPEELEF